MTRDDLCADMDHPGVTYNPWLDRTWCLCGARTYPGDAVTHPHVACCGGPLAPDPMPTVSRGADNAPTPPR